MIQEIDGKFCIISHETNKNLGCYDTPEEAEARLAEITTYAAELKQEHQATDRIEFAKKAIKMPILPAKPAKAVDGRDVTQELIDAVLAYDSTVRPAIVKLDKLDAHSAHNGQQNSAVLGRVEKTYEKDGMIIADVLPARGFEELLPILAAEDGSFPGRSIEADKLTLGEDSKKLWLEAVALCGTQRPALNLPAVSFTKEGEAQKITYEFTPSTNSTMTSPTGGNTPMAEPEVKQNIEEQPQTFTGVVPIEKQLNEMKVDFAKRIQERDERISQLEALNLDKDLEHWVKSPKMLRKVPSTLRANVINLIKAAAEQKQTTKFVFAKQSEPMDVPIPEAIKALLEALPDSLVGTNTIGELVPNQFADVPVTRIEKERQALTKIRQYCKENNLRLDNHIHFAKAEAAIKQEHPELWEAD